MKALWDEWKIPLLCVAFLSIGPAQCTYDNYVKWQVAKAAKEIGK